MKNKTLFVVFCVLPFIVLGCANCSGKSEGQKEKEPFSVVGTTYAAFNSISHSKQEVYHVFRFFDETNFEVSYRKVNWQGGFILEPKLGTYILEFPMIYLTYDMFGMTTFEGTFIDENAFRIKFENGELLEYIKRSN